MIFDSRLGFLVSKYEYGFRTIENCITPLTNIYSNVVCSLAEIDNINKQLDEFIDWFKRFLLSYQRLLVEIDRRNRETKRRQTFISFCNSVLKNMIETEQNARSNFLENEGKWIPTSLCPPIVV